MIGGCEGTEVRESDNLLVEIKVLTIPCLGN